MRKTNNKRGWKREDEAIGQTMVENERAGKCAQTLRAVFPEDKSVAVPQPVGDTTDRESSMKNGRGAKERRRLSIAVRNVPWGLRSAKGRCRGHEGLAPDTKTQNGSDRVPSKLTGACAALVQAPSHAGRR